MKVVKAKGKAKVGSVKAPSLPGMKMKMGGKPAFAGGGMVRGAGAAQRGKKFQGSC